METLGGLKWQKIALVCGFIFIGFIGIGWLGIAHFILPAPANLGLAETLVYFTETYHMQMLIGNSCLIIGAAFLCPASIEIGFKLAEIEGKNPVWAVATAVGGIAISVIIFFNGCMWIACAYRPWVDAEIVQIMSDFAWMAFLLGWVYLELEIVGAAIVNLRNKAANPMVPHWFSWASLAGGLVLMGAGGIAFFQSGPFSYHGLLGFYLPMIVWGLWLIGELIFMLKDIKSKKQALIKMGAEQ